MDFEKLIDMHTLVQAKYDRDLRQALYDQGLTPEQLAEKYKKNAEIGWALYTKVIKGLRKIKVKKEDGYKKLELPLLPENSWKNVLQVEFLIYDDTRVYCCIERKGKDYGATGQRNGGDHKTTKSQFCANPFLVEVFSLPNMEKLIADTLNAQEWFLAKTYPLLEKEIEKDRTKPLLLSPPASPPPQHLRTEIIEDPVTGQQIEVTWWGEEPPKLGRIVDPISAVDLYAELTAARANMHIQNLQGLNTQNDQAAVQYLTHILDSAWTNAYSSGPKYESPFDFEKFSGDLPKTSVVKRKWWQFWKT